MKKMKKFASVLLALVMTLSLAVTAFAAEGTGSITINDASATATYTAYKVFDLTYSGDNYAYTMAADSQFKSLVENYKVDDTNVFTLTPSANDANVLVVTYTQFDAKAFAAYLRDAVRADGERFTGTELENATVDGVTTASIDGLELGYYFVNSNVGTLCVLDSVSPDVEVTEKNEKPTEEKTNDNEDNTKKIGDTVNFTIKVNAQAGAENYVVHDRMGAGLTLNADSITVTPVDASNAATIKTAGLDDNCTFEVSFSKAYLDTITDATEITITYSAVINENAVTESIGNTSKLTYGENEATPESGTNGGPDNPDPSVYDIIVNKFDGNDQPLDGAKFRLYDAETEGNEIPVVYVPAVEADPENGIEATAAYYRPAKADELGKAVEIEAGSATIKGLGNGTYWLEETQAPQGYNALTAREKVEIVNGATGTAEVINQTGAELPSTGGIGTTIFYVGGGILIAAAGILLITKKRMGAAE